MRARFIYLDLFDTVFGFQKPGVILKQIFLRIGIGMNLYPSFNAINSRDSPDVNQFGRFRRHRAPSTIYAKQQLSCLFAFFNQLFNALRQLCTLTNPMRQTVSVNTQTLFLATSNWIEETDTLNETTITGATAVGYGQMIKWALFRATT
jgi:hypothetical protein